MQPHAPTWIVVADAGRARILYLERPGAPVRRVFEDEDEAGRRFALADVVNEMAANDDFGRLILVAARPTLAELRGALDDGARAHIAIECEQDLSRFSDEMVLYVLGNVGNMTAGISDNEEDDPDAGSARQGMA